MTRQGVMWLLVRMWLPIRTLQYGNLHLIHPIDPNSCLTIWILMLQTQPQLWSFTLILYLMDLQPLNKTLMLEINTALDMCQITPASLKEIWTQNGLFNSNSNSMSSFVSQWNWFKFEIPYRSYKKININLGIAIIKKTTFFVRIFDISPCVLLKFQSR